MDKKKRPRIKPRLSTINKITEWVGWIFLVAIWGLTLSTYTALPDIIPTHYNLMGEADGFGKKSTIFQLPIIATVLFVGMTILNQFPYIFNYGFVEITEDNAEEEYKKATQMIRYLKLIIVILFGGIVYQTAQPNLELSIWFLPLMLVMVVVPIVYFIIAGKSST